MEQLTEEQFKNLIELTSFRPGSATYTALHACLGYPVAGGGVTARAWWAPINPAPVAPSAPAVTRASTRRRGVDAIVFMVVCLSNRVAMKGSVGGHA